MSIRVVHVATGNAGRIALAQLIEDPRFELVGLVVSNLEKVGRDAGELAGLDVTTGVLAGASLDEALTSKPDCVVYCALTETRLFEAMAEIQQVMETGINVVGTAPVPLMYPWGILPQSMIDPIEKAGQENGASLFITGVDPGWTNDLLPFAIASSCQSVEKVTCYEIADYATYDGGPVMFDVMGFGRELGDLPMLFKPGILSSAWGVTIRQLAAGFGVELDEITEWFEQEPAPEDFEVAAGHISKGTVAAVRFKIGGIVGGKEVFVVDHTTRLRDDLRPDWPRAAQEGGSYRLEIVGEPSYRVDVCPTSERGDHNYSAIAACSGRAVNAIPDVIAAPPGIRTVLDLPLFTGKGLLATTLDN